MGHPGDLFFQAEVRTSRPRETVADAAALRRQRALQRTLLYKMKKIKKVVDI